MNDKRIVTLCGIDFFLLAFVTVVVLGCYMKIHLLKEEATRQNKHVREQLMIIKQESRINHEIRNKEGSSRDWTRFNNELAELRVLSARLKDQIKEETARHTRTKSQ